MTNQAKIDLDAIIKTIADTGIVSKIILFGSMARGDETPNSDIDLCVLTPITDRRPIDIAIDLRKKLRNLKRKTPLDILAYNQDRFAEHASRSSSFANVINTEGVVVYER
jgi:predicted nucleotidyltransferase